MIAQIRTFPVIKCWYYHAQNCMWTFLLLFIIHTTAQKYSMAYLNGKQIVQKEWKATAIAKCMCRTVLFFPNFWNENQNDGKQINAFRPFASRARSIRTTESEGRNLEKQTYGTIPYLGYFLYKMYKEILVSKDALSILCKE